jgi:hypothetical protein
VNSIVLAQTLVTIVGFYLAFGFVFAIFFVIWGVGKIDPSAAGSTPGFRAIIVPGVALLWPLLAKRWWQSVHTPLERNAHRTAAQSQRDKT